jgi:class 3 adenylate cyclase
MTVLFSDIRGFTRPPGGTPEQIVAQLNEYFSAMVDVLFAHHGTLDKFVGDMVMGLFGAPVQDARHADHAVAAALEMAKVLAELNGRWSAAGTPPLQIGIGINSGEMIAGNIGSDTIMSYTVIGDAVSLAARLESLNKDFGTRILISEATRSRLTIDVETRCIGEVTVKGRKRSRCSGRRNEQPTRVLGRAPQGAGRGAGRREQGIDDDTSAHTICLCFLAWCSHPLMPSWVRSACQGQGTADRANTRSISSCSPTPRNSSWVPPSAASCVKYGVLQDSRPQTSRSSGALAQAAAVPRWRGRSSCSTPTA